MKKHLFIPLLCLLLGCSKQARMEGFDSQKWQQDKKGCQDQRRTMVREFDTIRLELYGRDENDVKDILGKPDAEQLMRRGQRVFIYYLEPGAHCTERNKLSEANRAEVRFNALNKVSEITYLRPIPAEATP
jgi:tetrahydromethanopterin S-methyltransferase subunit H